MITCTDGSGKTVFIKPESIDLVRSPILDKNGQPYEAAAIIQAVILVGGREYMVRETPGAVHELIRGHQ